MTPLCQRFIEDMELRGLAPTTQRNYIHHVAGFAAFYKTSREKLDLEAVRQYELYLLQEKKLSPESINSFVSAAQFLFLTTLEMPWGKECFPRVRRPQKLPLVLSPAEVAQFFEHVPSLRYRAALMTLYGAGLRISEAVALKIGYIDSSYVMLSERLRSVLRCYYRAARRGAGPGDYLFPSWREGRHMSSGALSVACRDASRQCGGESPHCTHAESARQTQSEAATEGPEVAGWRGPLWKWPTFSENTATFTGKLTSFLWSSCAS